MREYIKKLQAKSEESRKQILIGTLVVSMFFVGVIWVSSFKYKFNNDEVAKIDTDQGVKPFALFGQTISDTYSNITASVGSIPSVKNEEVQTDLEIKDEGKQIDLIPVIN